MGLDMPRLLALALQPEWELRGAAQICPSRVAPFGSNTSTDCTEVGARPEFETRIPKTGCVIPIWISDRASLSVWARAWVTAARPFVPPILISTRTRLPDSQKLTACQISATMLSTTPRMAKTVMTTPPPPVWTVVWTRI